MVWFITIPQREASLHWNADGSLGNEHVVKCQLSSCLCETEAAEQWAWEWEWVSFYPAGSESEWTPWRPTRWFQRQAEKDEIRKREREKSQGYRYRGGGCLGGRSSLSINRISNKQPCSPGKYGTPSSQPPQHFDMENIKSLSLYTHYQYKADYSTVGCSVLTWA